MKAIDFYKFIHERKIEFHWTENEETKEDDVIFFPSYHDIEALRKLLTAYDLDEGGIICRMKDGYFAFWASDILEAHGIELIEIFGEPENK